MSQQDFFPERTPRRAGPLRLDQIPPVALHAMLAKSTLDPLLVKDLQGHRNEPVALAAVYHVSNTSKPLDQAGFDTTLRQWFGSVGWTPNDEERLLVEAFCLGLIPYSLIGLISGTIAFKMASEISCPPVLQVYFGRSENAAVRGAIVNRHAPKHRTFDSEQCTLNVKPTKNVKHLRPAQLRRLARRPDLSSRLDAAEYPSCPVELLREMWADVRPSKRCYEVPLRQQRNLLMIRLVARMDLPEDLLLDMIREQLSLFEEAPKSTRPPELFDEVQSGVRCPPRRPALRVTTAWYRHELSHLLARHPNCPTEWRDRILDTLFDADFHDAQQMIAIDLESDPLVAEAHRLKLLGKMLEYEPGDALRWFALNSLYCEPMVLARAANSWAFLERVAVARHPRTPPTVRAVLLNDGISWVRWAAAGAMNVEPAWDDAIRF